MPNPGVDVHLPRGPESVRGEQPVHRQHDLLHEHRLHHLRRDVLRSGWDLHMSGRSDCMRGERHLHPFHGLLLELGLQDHG